MSYDLAPFAAIFASLMGAAVAIVISLQSARYAQAKAKAALRSRSQRPGHRL